MKDGAALKRLLVAESDLNRVHLIHELTTLAAGVRTAVDQAGHMPAIASTAMVLAGNLLANRHATTNGSSGGATWIGGLIKGIGVVSSLWAACRPRPS